MAPPSMLSTSTIHDDDYPMKKLLLIVLLPLLVLPVSVQSWLPPSSSRRYSCCSRTSSSSFSFPPSVTNAKRCGDNNNKNNNNHKNVDSMTLASTPSDEVDTTTTTSTSYVGKTVYQRTFYRLSPGSQVTIPNALMIEERLRYRLSDSSNTDADNDDLVSYGPRTLIVREGSDMDELTDELFRMDIVAPKDQPHSGPRRMDTEIASILFLASNPQWIQGDVLELSCGNGGGMGRSLGSTTATAAAAVVGSGVVGLLGCMAAKWVAMSPQELQSYKQQQKQQLVAEQENIMTVPKTSTLNKNPFPPRMHHLTLSDESPNALEGALPMIQKHFSSSQVSLKELQWNLPPMRRSYAGSTNRRNNFGPAYRTIIGSDLELNYPSSKELARTVANTLLPSNEFAMANIREGADTSPSFGAMGMDPEPSPTSSTRKDKVDEQVDASVPPIFIHTCPEYREDSKYLRQFLEKGFRMTVNSGYMKMERLQFVVQTLADGTTEDELDELDDLEVLEEGSTTYQSLMATHHPDYAGEGSGEYFFPLETGAYEGGSAANTYLELEEGGSSM
jgi:hypothetical protein